MRPLLNLQISRFAYLSTSDTTCIIGARQYGAITVIVCESRPTVRSFRELHLTFHLSSFPKVQAIVNVYFIGAFLLALRSSWLCNRPGRRLAISSAWAEMVGLVVSGESRHALQPPLTPLLDSRS